MNAPKLLAAATLLAAGAAWAGPVTVDASCKPQISPLEARLVQKAAEGPDSLRSFLFIRRNIYLLDPQDTAARVSEIEAARNACTKTATAATSRQPRG